MARNDVAPTRDGSSPGGQRVSPSGWRRHPTWALVAGAGLVSYAWVDGASVPLTARSLAGVLIPGAVLGLIATARPPQRIEPPAKLDILGMSYWIICLGALFEWEAASFRDNSPPWHPSLTDLVNPLIAPHPVKSAAILVWLLAGWALVKR